MTDTSTTDQRPAEPVTTTGPTEDFIEPGHGTQPSAPPPAPRATVYVPPTLGVPGGFEEIEPELVPLFTLEREGLDPVTYSVPAAENAGTLLRYLRNARTMGQVDAAAQLLEELIGEEGYTALLNEPKLKLSTVTAIATRAANIISGKAPDVDYETGTLKPADPR